VAQIAQAYEEFYGFDFQIHSYRDICWRISELRAMTWYKISYTDPKKYL
jgi:hypothetical protein